MYIVGIDPDTKESGVAVWSKKTKTIVTYSAMSFFELYDFLTENKDIIELVRIEAGWLNKKSNFHGNAYQTKRAGERIAKNVGSNHETGRKIVEMCDYLKLNHSEVLPLGKLNKEYFKALTKLDIKNQDIIDAVMLVFDYK